MKPRGKRDELTEEQQDNLDEDRRILAEMMRSSAWKVFQGLLRRRMSFVFRDLEFYADSVEDLFRNRGQLMVLRKLIGSSSEVKQYLYEVKDQECQTTTEETKTKSS